LIIEKSTALTHFHLTNKTAKGESALFFGVWLRMLLKKMDHHHYWVQTGKVLTQV
jgi:hypothetical protein